MNKVRLTVKKYKLKSAVRTTQTREEMPLLWFF